jgi:aspartate/methionine/tyrosine aminotransferase
VAGALDARRAAADYLGRRGLPTDPDQIVLAPGSKPLLFGLVAAVPGDVVLPCPSWVSYAAQAALMGRRVRAVPVPESSGGVPDPKLLDEMVGQARRDGADPRILVVTTPDNPTGTVPPGDLVEAVCEVAERHDLIIVSDEIYRDLAWPGHDVVSPASLAPGRTAVTSGLSKAMALGGYRIGFARLPDDALGERLRPDLVGVPSEAWSSLAAPMQAVAAYVLDEPDAVVDHVRVSRRMHQTVATAVHRQFVAIGAACRPPSGAFYLYPDLSSLRTRLAERGITSGIDLTRSSVPSTLRIWTVLGPRPSERMSVVRTRPPRADQANGFCLQVYQVVCCGVLSRASRTQLPSNPSASRTANEIRLCWTSTPNACCRAITVRCCVAGAYQNVRSGDHFDRSTRRLPYPSTSTSAANRAWWRRSPFDVCLIVTFVWPRRSQLYATRVPSVDTSMLAHEPGSRPSDVAEPSRWTFHSRFVLGVATT